MFHHILIATDMSPRAISATMKGIQIAHQFNSTVTLLNVHEEFMSDTEMQMLRVSVAVMKEEFLKTAESARQEMKKIIRELHADNIEVDFLIREGKASKTICEVASELKVDLIVIGTNGRDNIHDFILGTTSEYVVRHSKCPVLVMPGS